MVVVRLLFMLLICSLLFPSVLLSRNQEKQIQGSLKNLEGHAVANASVLLRKAETGTTIAFTRSDENGFFSFEGTTSFQLGDYEVTVSHIAYKPTTQRLKTGQWNYEITLEGRDERIPEVNVGVRPQLTELGDTLRYVVSSFARPEDRSIAEVLSRMPGIRVSASGKVSFQGKEIGSLYLDGVDLLAARYGIATKSVPHRIVTEVEVLRNHQPINVLRERVLTDDVSLNLVISDEGQNTMTGDLLLGAGLPLQYQLKSNLMQFHRRFKYLHVLRSNNSGDPVDEELFSHQGSSKGGAYQLSLGRLGKPPLPRSRYYDNLSGLLSTSQHYNLPSNWQWKTGLDIFADRDRYSNDSRTLFFHRTDTTVIEEQLQHIMRPLSGQWSMSLYQNEADRFINLTSELEYAKRRGNSFSETALGRNRLRERNFRFVQNLHYVPLLKGSDILTIQGNFSYGKQPATLLVPAIEQWMETRRTAVDLLGRYLFSTRKILQQQYEAGVVYFTDHLESDLSFDPSSGMLSNLNGALINRLSWNQFRSFVGGEYSFRFPWIRLHARLPLSMAYVRSQDPDIGTSASRGALFLAPDLRATYTPFHGHEWQVQYQHLPQFSNIYGMHRGLLMLNHQDFRRMDADIHLERSDQFSSYYKYTNTSKLLMGNLSYSYQLTRAEALQRLQVTENYLTYENVDLNNQRRNHQFMASIDKHFVQWNMNSRFSVQHNLGFASYLLDQAIVPSKYDRFSIHPFINIQSLGRLNWQYYGQISWASQKYGEAQDMNTGEGIHLNNGGSGSRTHHQDHQFSVGYSRARVFFVTLKNHYVLSFPENQSTMHNFLSDLHLRARLPKRRLDIEFEIRNIMDRRHYEAVHMSEQFLYVVDYGLRGRQALLSISFSF